MALRKSMVALTGLEPATFHSLGQWQGDEPPSNPLVGGLGSLVMVAPLTGLEPATFTLTG